MFYESKQLSIRHRQMHCSFDIFLIPKDRIGFRSIYGLLVANKIQLSLKRERENKITIPI